MTEGDGSIDENGPLELDWRHDLRELYEELDREVASLGPKCDLSGRCCRFLEYGHTLFLSSGEVEFLLDLAPAPARPLDQGATCPWQNSRGHCTARESRPLGCRVYHCDPAFLEELHRLSERFIDRLKRLSSKHNIAWNYAPLHRQLHDARRRGRFPPVDAALAFENLASNPS
jgi:Fe-S-cluster containining protein